MADAPKTASMPKRGDPKRPSNGLQLLYLQIDDFFRTKSCGKQQCVRRFPRRNLSSLLDADIADERHLGDMLALFKGIAQLDMFGKSIADVAFGAEEPEVLTVASLTVMSLATTLAVSVWWRRKSW